MYCDEISVLPHTSTEADEDARTSEGDAVKYKSVAAMPGMSFSAVGFGCWGISGGDVWNGTSDAASVATVHAALDLGITFFDVAPVYGFGHAEEVLGGALAGRRDEVLIGSKCGLLWDDGGVIRNDLSPASIRSEIDDSLRRLQTEHLDIYQMHWPDPATPVDDSMEVLADLQAAGKIRHIGVTNFSAERTQQCRNTAPIASYQGLYNLLEHNPVGYHALPLEYRTADEILPMVQQEGMAFFPYSPLFQGLLTDTYEHTGNFDDSGVRSENPKLRGELFEAYYQASQELRTFASEIGRSLNHVAINWLVSQPAVTSVIAGGQIPEHVSQNAAAVEWELTPDMLERIDVILAPYAARGLL